MAINGVEPTINLRLAQAYGTARTAPTRTHPTGQTAPPTPTAPTGPIGAMQNVDGPIRFSMDAARPVQDQPTPTRQTGAFGQAQPIGGGLSIKAASATVRLIGP